MKAIRQFRQFIDLHPCPYCKNKGRMIREFNEIQGIPLYKGVCSKKCDVRAMTFAVKHRECAVELWNAAYVNVIRKTKGD